MYATNSFDDNDVTLQACVAFYCPEIASIGAGSLCDDWLTPTSNQDCGEPGTYDVYHTEDIPEYDDIPSALWWFVRSAVSVKMMVGNDEECDGQADNSYSMSHSMVGFASLAMVGAAVYSSWKKRRSGDGGSEDEKISRFVEMGDFEVF